MQLTELNPRWCCDADIVIGGINQHFENRHGMAISFGLLGGKFIASPRIGGQIGFSMDFPVALRPDSKK